MTYQGFTQGPGAGMPMLPAGGGGAAPMMGPASVPPNAPPWGDSLGAQPSPPPGPPQLVPISPPPTPEFQDIAFKYISKVCKASAEFVRRKTERLMLWKRLYQGEIGIREWANWEIDPLLNLSRSRRERALDDKYKHLSNYVHPIAPYVNSLAHNIYLQIFNGPEWFVLTPKTAVASPTQPNDLPVAEKLQQLFKTALKDGEVEALTLDGLIEWITEGTLCVKVFWHRFGVNAPYYDMTSGQAVNQDDTIYEAPIIQPIKLNQWLPDPQARHSDCQRWRGIGHRVIRTYEDCLASFERGDYTLNLAEFKERFEHIGSTTYNSTIDSSFLDHDIDTMQYQEQDLSLVKIWEWQGRVPTPEGLKETVCHIATEGGAIDPSTGVLIGLTTRPVSVLGLRSFAVAHYTPQPSAYGRGMIEEQADNFFMLSQTLGMIQDVSRRSANCAYMTKRGSTISRQLQEHGGPLPGRIYEYDSEGDIIPFPNIDTNIQVQSAVATQLLSVIERGTGVTETFQGLQGQDKTATETAVLQRQSAAPASVKAQIFAAKIIRPAWKLALGLLEQYTVNSRQVVIRNYEGQIQPLTITPEEIQQCEWELHISLTDSDYTSIARAQSIERVMQTAINLKPLMAQQEGQNLSISELFKRWLDCLTLGNTDRIVQPFSSQEQMMMQQIQQLLQQAQQQGQVIQQLQQQLQQAQKEEQSEPQGGDNGSGAQRMCGPGCGQGHGGGEQHQQHSPSMPPLVRHGGPMGDEQSDANAMAQFLQMNALMNQGGMR